MTSYWSDKAFWSQATWRAFRTVAQAAAGLLTVNHVSSAFNAPWLDIVGASLIAGLISLLQSIDRERAVGAALPEPKPAEPARLTLAEAELAAFGPGCGGDQR